MTSNGRYMQFITCPALPKVSFGLFFCEDYISIVTCGPVEPGEFEPASGRMGIIGKISADGILVLEAGNRDEDNRGLRFDEAGRIVVARRPT